MPPLPPTATETAVTKAISMAAPMKAAAAAAAAAALAVLAALAAASGVVARCREITEPTGDVPVCGGSDADRDGGAQDDALEPDDDDELYMLELDEVYGDPLLDVDTLDFDTGSEGDDCDGCDGYSDDNNGDDVCDRGGGGGMVPAVLMDPDGIPIDPTDEVR
jgi:hypothetical protein